MKTLIVYATKHGCTEKCATQLSGQLTGEVALCNLKTGPIPDLVQYDQVIIGGSIHIGKIQKDVSDFCARNLAELKIKKVGLFICCMYDGEVAETELNSSFPQELLTTAVAKEYFGGEFIFKKMNFLDRLIVKKVAKIDQDESKIITANINKFVQSMNNA